jgi:hypothetical protein
MSQVLNLDKSQRVDIVCKRGDTFKMSLQVQDDEGGITDLTGYDFAMEVRYADTDDGESQQPSSGPQDDGYVFNSNDINGEITVDLEDGANGNVSFTIANTDMKTIDSGLYVYDIQMTNTDNIVETILYGVFKVNEDVTIL